MNALGIFLMHRERWDEAAAMFRKADVMGESKNGACRANLGLALLKGGKPAEAIPVLEEAARIGPQAPVLICVINLHMALAQAELRRWDEAEEQFRARKTRRAACARLSLPRSRKRLSNAGGSWSSMLKRNRSRRGSQDFRCGCAGGCMGRCSIDLDLRPLLPSPVEEFLAVEVSPAGICRGPSG